MCLIEPLSFQHITDIKNDIFYSFIKINLLIHLLICFWLHWVFVAAHGLYLVAVSGSYLCCLEWVSRCGSFPCGACALERSLSNCRAQACLVAP